MIANLIILRLRECHRRPFPYLVAGAMVLLAAASRVFVAFSFGAEVQETINLAISAVFLAGFLHAAFLASAIIARDLERGTLGLLLTKPLGLGTYLVGTYIGVAIGSAILCGIVGIAVGALFALYGSSSGHAIAGPELFAGCARAWLPVLVLEAAALLASAAVSRAAAPLLLFGFFLAASLSAPTVGGWLLPDFGLFALEASGSPSIAYLVTYAILLCAALLALAYIVLSMRPALRANN